MMKKRQKIFFKKIFMFHDGKKLCESCNKNGYVYNYKLTYISIATLLRSRRNVFFAWTDKNHEAQYDIFMGIVENPEGPIQGGLKSGEHLMVGISRVGFFGFRTDSESVIYPSYVAEKLFVHGLEAEEIATLINEVRREYKGYLREVKV
jgi:hypothetical protein